MPLPLISLTEKLKSIFLSPENLEKLKETLKLNSKPANILIIGESDAGKRTLINAVFDKNLKNRRKRALLRSI